MFKDPLLTTHFHRKRLQTRSYDTLVGICKGILVDGQVSQPEAEFLHNWLQANPDLLATFPCGVLADRLATHLADNILDQEEAQDLLFLLQDLTGEKGQQGKGDAPTSLAFNCPMPSLEFAGQAFCLTGTFQSGIRTEIAVQLEDMGAVIKKTVVKTSPCCLVVGSLVTPAWIHSTHGRKIEAAVKFREQGCPSVIVSEDHLFDEMRRYGTN